LLREVIMAEHENEIGRNWAKRDEHAVSRRGLLKTLGGAATAGAGIVFVGQVAPAGATGTKTEPGAFSSDTATPAVLAVSTGAGGVGVKGQSYSPNGSGVRGLNFADSGSAIGVTGVSTSDDGIGVQGSIDADSGYAVLGRNISHSGSGAGVKGQSSSPNGSGVRGLNFADGKNDGTTD
jgi:hypothetical protein